MKNIATVVLVLLSINMFSQESIMDKVAMATCEYLQKDEIKSLSKDEMTVKLGLFMISYYSDNEKQFEKEGVIVDWDSEKGGEEFGHKIGIKMAGVCPETLMAFADDIDSGEEDTFLVEGKMKSISGNDFNYINIEDKSGKSQKFLWLGNFKGSDKLIDNKKVKGLKVSVTYKNTECFSPKLQEYIIVKEIIEIEYL